jgi:aminoglycoside phosphotransferase (APT) family kinase protein
MGASGAAMPGEPGRLLGEGRAALVYDIGAGRVLRRYRVERDTTAEARMMAWVGAHGVPVPEVFDAEGSDLVMERIDGPSLLTGLGAHPWRVPGVGRVLADLHHLLDRVPVAPWMEQRFVPDPAAVRLGVLHCDLHPDNVMLGREGPVLIDWTRACAGERGADLAQTSIIVADLGLADNRVERTAELVARRVLLRSFLLRVDAAEARRWLPAVAADRLCDSHMTAGERTRLARYIAARLGDDA